MTKKFIAVEKFADNGAFSHYELVDENGETVISNIMQAKEEESRFFKLEKEIDDRIERLFRQSEKTKDHLEEAKYNFATNSLILLKIWITNNLH